MDGNGWTGLDRERTVTDIRNFASASERVVNMFIQTSSYLFSELFYLWASPNAVNFSNSFKMKYNNIMNQMHNEIVRVISDAERAYTYMAQAQGLPGIYAIEDEYHQNVFAGINTESAMFDLLYNRDNVVGMNVLAVKQGVIPEYKARMQNVINSIDYIPTSISLYDDENGQQHAFWANITILKSYLQQLFDSILNEVTIATENEANTIELAKNRAIDALNNRY